MTTPPMSSAGSARGEVRGNGPSKNQHAGASASLIRGHLVDLSYKSSGLEVGKRVVAPRYPVVGAGTKSGTSFFGNSRPPNDCHNKFINYKTTIR
jgi:hypothetical protein